jgi:hypothetical protein
LFIDITYDCDALGNENNYTLIDSDFSINLDHNMVMECGFIPAIIPIYRERRLNIARNIALFIIWYDAKYHIYDDASSINDHLVYIDAELPELKYGELYHNDIVKEYNKLVVLK